MISRDTVGVNRLKYLSASVLHPNHTEDVPDIWKQCMPVLPIICKCIANAHNYIPDSWPRGHLLISFFLNMIIQNCIFWQTNAFDICVLEKWKYLSENVSLFQTEYFDTIKTFKKNVLIFPLPSNIINYGFLIPEIVRQVLS